MDCQWCDISDPETGPALEGKPRPSNLVANLVARILRIPRPVVCHECWFGHNDAYRGQVEGGYKRA